MPELNEWPPGLFLIFNFPAILLKLMLGRLSGRFEPINFVISLLIGFGTLGGLILCRRVKDGLD